MTDMMEVGSAGVIHRRLVEEWVGVGRRTEDGRERHLTALANLSA